MEGSNRETGNPLLFLTDEQLRKGIEAMFFAYRGFTADPDRILADLAYGRAHHRAVHFINRSPGTTVNNLLALLGVTTRGGVRFSHSFRGNDGSRDAQPI